MKRFELLFVFFSLFGMAWSQNTITLTFSGKNENNAYVRMDSVKVVNLTQNWEEMLIYPDTSITMINTWGLADFPEQFPIQVTPNPFHGNVKVQFHLEKKEPVKIFVTDMMGRLCISYYDNLPAGDHLFNVSLFEPQMYILTVRTSEGSNSVKLINSEKGGQNSIEYVGNSDQPFKKAFQKGTLTHNILPGDNLHFTGYAQINDILRISHADGIAPSEDMSIQLTFFSTDNVPCPGLETVTDYDGNEYSTVQIGSQCWMRQNLRTTHYANGTEIPLGNASSSYAAYRYYPNNDSSNVFEYGFLYNRSAVVNGAFPDSVGVIDVQGVCPSGWHLPKKSEWNQLVNYTKSQSEYLCGNSTAKIAKALASTTGWVNYSDNCCVGDNPATNNATGFSALPAGARYTDDTQFGRFSKYWIFAPCGSFYCELSFELMYYDYEIWYEYDHSNSAFTVRCIHGDGLAEVAPFVTTNEFHVDGLGAIGGGSVFSDGGAIVTARGVCWDTVPNPTVAGDHTTDGIGIGSFSSTVTGWLPGKTYYVRAYAINSVGISYGEERIYHTFIVPNGDAQPCPGDSTLTDYDGNVYNTVQIGNQCWMKENLRTTHLSDGTVIPLGTTTNLDTAFYYDIHNNPATLPQYGYLYNWVAAMHGTTGSNTNPSGVQGVCPTGWHIPSNAEWSQLSQYLRQHGVYTCDGGVAKSLASTAIWNMNNVWACSVGNDLGQNNASRFNAYPVGSFPYNNFKDCAYFWSTTEEEDIGYEMRIDRIESTMELLECSKTCGFSIRCLRD